jgi:hydroxymethylpyrimidine pyrophosphatase-like HAD family hydrolase
MDLFMNYRIIAVDFDGTLCFSNWPELGEPNTPLIKYLKNEKALGNKIILWTCRAGQALSDATKWCADYGLTFDAVNDNLPEVVELYGNNSRKITCDIYIDDKSILPDAVGL